MYTSFALKKGFRIISFILFIFLIPSFIYAQSRDFQSNHDDSNDLFMNNFINNFSVSAAFSVTVGYNLTYPKNISSCKINLYEYPYDAKKVFPIPRESILRNGTLYSNSCVNFIGYNAFYENRRRGIFKDVSILDNMEGKEDFIGYKDEFIRKYAQDILLNYTYNPNSLSVLLAATIISSWVHNNIVYTPSKSWVNQLVSPRIVLERRKGVCDEMAHLTVAMLRSLGIPSRVVGGIAYSNIYGWSPHAWVEVWVNDSWIPFDPAYGEYGWVDVTHIKLTNDSKVFVSFKGEDNVVMKPYFEINNLYLKNEFYNLSIYLEPFYPTVSGDYQLIRVVIKNNGEEYLPDILEILVPEEIQVVEYEEGYPVVIKPYQTFSKVFILNITKSLDPDYEYTFPIVLHLSRGSNITYFKWRKDGIKLSNEIVDLYLNKEKSEKRDIEEETKFFCKKQDSEDEKVNIICYSKDERNLFIKQCPWISYVKGRETNHKEDYREYVFSFKLEDCLKRWNKNLHGFFGIVILDNNTHSFDIVKIYVPPKEPFIINFSYDDIHKMLKVHIKPLIQCNESIVKIKLPFAIYEYSYKYFIEDEITLNVSSDVFIGNNPLYIVAVCNKSIDFLTQFNQSRSISEGYIRVSSRGYSPVDKITGFLKKIYFLIVKFKIS